MTLHEWCVGNFRWILWVVLQSLKTLVAMRDTRGVLIVHADGSVTALLPKPLAAQVRSRLP